MTISEAIASQGFDEPAKVGAARPDLAAIAGLVAELASDRVTMKEHMRRARESQPVSWEDVGALQHRIELAARDLAKVVPALLDEVARLTRERDEARKWARSAMTVLLEQESCGDPEEDEEAREVLARWDAEAEVKP